MSHLFGDTSDKTKMAPKVEPTKPGGSSGTDVESKAQIPDIIDMGLLRKRRGVAKGSFTRITHTLQTLYDEENLSEVKIQVETEFKRLDQALEKVIQRHEEFMDHPDATEGDDEYMDQIEESYAYIKKMYGDFFNNKKAEEEKDVTHHFKAGTFTDDNLSADDKMKFQLHGFGFDPQKEAIKFDGSSTARYKTFRVKWEYVDQKLTQMGRSGAEKLIELKKTLQGEARQYVIDLPDQDENYLAALDILDDFYYDNAVFVGSAINKLMDCQKMTQESSAKDLYLSLTKAEQTLKGLMVTEEQRGDLIFLAVIQSKLNNRLLHKWLDLKNKKKDSDHPLGTTANLEDLKMILRSEIKVKSQIDEIKGQDNKKNENKKNSWNERRQENKSSMDSRKSEKDSNTTLKNTFVTSAGQKTTERKPFDRANLICNFCDTKGHYTSQCSNLRSKPSSQIMKTIKDKRICWRCLNIHKVGECKSSWLCTRCDSSIPENKRKHSNILHEALLAFYSNSSNASNRMNATRDEKRDNQDKRQTSTSAVCTNDKSQVILQSVMAWLKGSDGSKIKVRVFLDPGSDVCLVRRDVANQIGLDGPSSNLSLQVAGGMTLKETKEKEVSFKLEHLNGSFVSRTIHAITKEKIVEDFSPIIIDPNQYEHLKKLRFTEGYPRKEKARIDVLLGEPYYTDIIVGAPIKGKQNDPKAIPTQLGMVLAGSFQTNKADKTYRVNYCTKPDLNKFWELEHIGILTEKENDQYTLEEEEALKMMEKVTSYSEIKKEWTTELLFKNKKDRIQNNYKRAKAVLISVENAARKQNHEKELNETFNELIQNGFAEEVPKEEKVDEKMEQVYYLQTFPVIKPERDSTKIRLVQNASAKDPQSGKSLNDLLYQGPCLLNDFVKILIGFRHNRYAFTCDISKMFLRVKLKRGMNALRFLWRNCNTEKKEIIYRMIVLAFGLNSSPFQAAWVTRRHAKMFKKEFELAYEAVNNKMYVDDVASGQMTIEVAKTEAKQILDLLALAGMTAAKWHTNEKEVLELIPEELKSPMNEVKVLGVQWNTDSDEITFDFVPQMVPTEIETKRTFLQQTAMLFDPLGILSPFILKAKLLFQTTWQANLKWDDHLPEVINEPWKKWKSQIPFLQEMKMKRCLVETNNKQIKKSTILAFGDASENAYGCCVYLLTLYEDVSMSCSLIFAKSRVAPIAEKKEGKLTIVRLELLAALITARASVYAGQALNVSNIICFTDSMITLGRIRKGHSNYKIWVARRLEEIDRLVKQENWRFCPGKLNPSDLASRGCDAKELLESIHWWKGPEFVTTPEKDWPKEDTKSLEENQQKEEQIEQKKDQIVLATTQTINPIFELVKRVSNWDKFQRIVCYVRRFGTKTQRKNKGNISIQELKETRSLLWKISQENQFQKEKRDLKTCQSVNKDSKLSEMNVFLDENELLRSKTRLILSEELTYDEKNPVILPSGCPIIEKFILNLHVNLGHASANYLLSVMREHFKILKSKREIKRIINTCLTKRCTKAQPLGQQMGPLPTQRMDQLECFAHCSTDLFGPMYVKHTCKWEKCVHPKETKVWGCIFTCLQSRAIHLEIVDNLSAEEFILALRRFISRVGIPKTLFSDNGTNFVAASKELIRMFKAINWNQVKEECIQKGIDWTFAVEGAPFTNGISERMIQTVKKHLRIIIGSAGLSRKHLEIILKETELIVNNRPLCVVSPDEDDLNPITPFQLMMGKTANFLPDPNWKKQAENPGNFTKMWRLRQKLQNEFWKKWKRDYLMKQDVRTKWKNPTNEDLMGKIVLINDDNLPKNSWKLAKIIETITSKDGLIRTLVVKTPTSILRRPIQKLSLLEGIT